MKTPPWKSAGRAATRASATHSQHDTHARGDHAGGNSLKTNPIGLSEHADSRGFFNGSSASPGASQGVGDLSGAPGRDKGTLDAPAPRAVDFGLSHELAVLAAIVAFPSVLARFKALGVGPEVFSWPAISFLAQFVMSWDRPEPLPVPKEHADAMLDPLDGRGLSLGDELEDRVAVLQACPTGDAWALRDLDRSLAALARRWLPEMFVYLNGLYAIGDTARAERCFIYFAGLISTHGDFQ